MWKVNYLVLQLVVGITSFYSQVNANNVTNNSQSDSPRQGRRTNMPDLCDTGDGSSGICMTRFNCMKQSGIVRGYCGTYGVCCETTMACGEINRSKRILIRNPAVISEIPMQCQYTIQPFSQNVCQLRIDFQQFSLLQPTLTQDLLICVNSLIVDKYTLCGENSNQHLYLPFNVANGVDHITLTFNMPQRDLQSRWRLMITQIECPAEKLRTSMFSNFVSTNSLQDLKSVFSSHNADYDLIAPSGCNQYYTNPTGTVQSFNFMPTLPAFYLPEMELVICIKQQPGTTMARYIFSYFSLSQQAGDPDYGFDEACHSTVYTPARKEDFLMIPQSNQGMDLRPTYYCGTSLKQGSTVIDFAPFILYWQSDGKTNASETGFSFSYSVM